MFDNTVVVCSLFPEESNLVILYPEIEVPPLNVGLVQDIFAKPPPGVPVAVGGALGTVKGVTPINELVGRDVPLILVAVTENL
jgi:hypothetical protein